MLSCFIAVKNLFKLSFTIYIIVKPLNWEHAFYIVGFFEGGNYVYHLLQSIKNIPSFSVSRIT